MPKDRLQRMYPGQAKQTPGTAEDHDHLNFVQRYLKPSQFPQIKNDDGTYSTHRMSSADNIVFPEIVQLEDGTLKHFKNWREAYDHAMKTGEYIQFKTNEEADRFAKSYKERWGELDAVGLQ
jgi:hypothetical protein